MKKSIVKVKLNSRADFIETLDEINFHFTEPYWQHDRIFVPKNYSRDKSLPRLSLRTIVKDPNKDATYALVLRRHFDDKKIDIINSVIVKDYTEAAHIVYQLGYELKAEVSRRREELDMGNTIKIYIDKIDSLPGYYSKIESDLSENDDSIAAREDLIETFKVLGVKRVTPIDQTYGELLDSSLHDTITG
jgi:predicted adenylyl cyclase CyaB